MPQPTIRLLYLEDDPGLGRLTERVLGREGMHVRIATKGTEAIQAVQNESFDAILVDYRLPGMSGMDVITELSTFPNTPPIIMITGEGNEALAVEAMKAGASDYLTKDSQGQFLKLAPMRIRQAIVQAQLAKDKVAAEEAQAKLLDELDSFAHTVAHDLKNPLQNIVLNLDRLELADETARQGILDQLRTELERSKGIVDSLLLLATVRKEELNLRPVSLSTGFRGALMRLQPQIEEAHATIDAPEDWPMVVGRSDWLEEVWANYISNALRYGGASPSITIGWAEDGEQIRAWVQDEGPGVPKDRQKQLFSSMVRASNHTESTGLGLSIVARIMDRLEGEAGLDEGYKDGARFFIRIPAPQLG